mgnify:CR=1 FL=1
MKPLKEQIFENSLLPFNYKIFTLQKFDAPWHFHPEYELTYIIESKGTRYVGDSIESFEEGDLVLVGSNLPHYWKNSWNTEIASAVVIQFGQNFTCSGIFDFNAFFSVKDLLSKAGLGLKFPTEIARKTGDIMIEMEKKPEAIKILMFLNILYELSQTADYKPLTSLGFSDQINSSFNDKRLEIINKHILQHFKTTLNLEETASLAGMEPESFCRYFKKMTKKTFTEYINHIRVGYASRLLIETNMSVTDICYESGFGNISNFNRFFKRIKETAPLTFRNKYRIG